MDNDETKSRADRSITTAKQRYERLVTDRWPFLNRARQCAELTLPTLIPPEGHNSSTQYYTPWQSVGARGVNNLASKLLIGLFPPNSPFFRMTIDDLTLEHLTKTDTNRAEVEKGLAKIEKAVQLEFEGTGMRNPSFTSIKHLIVSGNALVYLPLEGGARVFSLDQYVARRDPKGHLLEVVIRECIDPITMDENLIPLLDEDDDLKEDMKEKSKGDTSEVIEIFTRFWRDGKRWRMVQEFNGKTIPGAVGSWPIDKPPIMALRWTAIEGEDYGRGYVEEYLGDLISLEGLSRSIVESAAATAKIVFLVNPNGVTNFKDVTEAESGEGIVGHKDDVHCLQADKQADLRVASDTIKALTERLSYAFLMTSAVQRQGERVTAEEIRTMVQDLEASLGGVYSVLSQEFQLPLVTRIMDRMSKQKKLPPLPKDVMKPQITTGLEALGRGQDLSKYQAFGQFLQTLPPELVQQYVNMGDMITRFGTALMIDMGGLVRTPQEIQQEQAQQQQMMRQQQMMEMAGKLGGPAIKAMSDQSLAVGDQQDQQEQTQ